MLIRALCILLLVTSLFTKVVATETKVDLNEFFENTQRVRGVSVDKVSGEILLIGEGDGKFCARRKDPFKGSANISDFSAAVLLYKDDIDARISFSLDPLDPLQPRGRMQKKVYWPDPGKLRFSTIGQALFDADWFIKDYSFNIKGKGRKLGIKGYKSELQLGQELMSRRERELLKYQDSPMPAGHHRLWFEVDTTGKELEETDRYSRLYFRDEDIKIVLKAHSLKVDATSRSGLADTDSPKLTKGLAAFLAQVNGDMSEIVEKSIEVYRMREVYVLLEIAKFCVQKLGDRLHMLPLQAAYDRSASAIKASETFTVKAFRGNYTKPGGTVITTVQGGISFGSNTGYTIPRPMSEQHRTFFRNAEQQHRQPPGGSAGGGGGGGRGGGGGSGGGGWNFGGGGGSNDNGQFSGFNFRRPDPPGYDKTSARRDRAYARRERAERFRRDYKHRGFDSSSGTPPDPSDFPEDLNSEFQSAWTRVNKERYEENLRKAEEKARQDRFRR